MFVVNKIYVGWVDPTNAYQYVYGVCNGKKVVMQVPTGVKIGDIFFPEDLVDMNAETLRRIYTGK